MTLTKEIVRNFREDFNEVIKPLCEKYNIEIEIGTITISPHNFRAKITANEKGEDGMSGKDAQLIHDHNRLYVLYGIPKDAIGKVYTYGGDQYKYIGLSESKRKNKIILEKVSNGQRYNTTVEMLLSMCK